MDTRKDVDRYRGCLIAGAAGDALGYAVEFVGEGDIFAKYGPRGITEYELHGGRALISDDTQMTLFTAEGLILSAHGMPGGAVECIALCYRDWLATQGEPSPYARGVSRLREVPELNHARAPGNTCISALRQEHLGSTASPINNSKGCGGVMRVAPIGLCLGAPGMDNDAVAKAAAGAAALTHGHELGCIPAAMLACIVGLLSHTDASIAQAVEESKLVARRIFPGAVHLGELLELVERAQALAAEDIRDLDAIKSLGAGWVAEETLAIAIFCALRHPDDLEAALTAAVNHGGDSDSTGAVAGNILGARLGLSGVPEKFRRGLELYDTIISVADKLYSL